MQNSMKSSCIDPDIQKIGIGEQLMFMMKTYKINCTGYEEIK